jgi:maltose-binding protein MalE
MWQQFQSLLTFPAIPAYSPIPEIVADADENVSQQQHAGEAAADTEETTGAMRVEKQAAINSACLRISLPI